MKSKKSIPTIIAIILIVIIICYLYFSDNKNVDNLYNQFMSGNEGNIDQEIFLDDLSKYTEMFGDN